MRVSFSNATATLGLYSSVALPSNRVNSCMCIPTGPRRTTCRPGFGPLDSSLASREITLTCELGGGFNSNRGLIAFPHLGLSPCDFHIRKNLSGPMLIGLKLRLQGQQFESRRLAITSRGSVIISHGWASSTGGYVFLVKHSPPPPYLSISATGRLKGPAKSNMCDIARTIGCDSLKACVRRLQRMDRATTCDQFHMTLSFHNASLYTLFLDESQVLKVLQIQGKLI
jgi:hypothetical protein